MLTTVLALCAAGCRTSTPAAGPDEAAAQEARPPTPPAQDTQDEAADEPQAQSDDLEPDFNDPTAGPDRDPDEPRQVPPLVLPSSAPGTDEAAAELLEDLVRFITDEQQQAGVPWPDLRNPDPVEAYQSHAAFQNWMAENNPTPSLVEAYTAPGSPERSFDLEMFDFRNAMDPRSGPADPPYSMRVEDLVHPAATGITDALLAQVPEGSAAIVYWDSVGRSDIFTTDGQLWNTSEGWTDVGPWVSIMAPTDVGWQVWWDELTDPPPPGSREQLGTPQPETPRRDV